MTATGRCTISRLLDQPSESTDESDGVESQAAEETEESHATDLSDDRDMILVSRKHISPRRPHAEMARPADESELDHSVSKGQAIRMDYEHLFARLRSPETDEKELA